jgi:hypothetical protein
MNFTYRNNVWKASATNSVIPSNSRPTTKYDAEYQDLNRKHGQPNPLRHWRKQLKPTHKTASSKQVSFRDLESAVYIGDSSIDCDSNIQLLKNNISPELSTCDGISIVDGDTGAKTCRGGTNKIRRSGSTIHGSKYCSSTKQYLQRRCKTYQQNQLYGKVVDSDKNLYQSTRCSPDVCKYVVHKSRNPTFSRQTSVSASAQILKKKNQAITNNGASYKSAFGMAPVAKTAYYQSSGDVEYRYYKINPISEPSCC